MNIFEFVSYQNAKVHAKHPIEEEKNIYYQKYIFWVFFSFVRTETLQGIENALY